MRDKLKNERYFEKYEKKRFDSIQNSFITMEKGEVVEKMIPYYKKSTFAYLLDYCISSYSSGKDIPEVKKRYMDTLHYMPIGWIPEVVRSDYKGNLINEYSESYTLW